MSRRSELITVDLPDNDGKVTPYYTYDGYLEEADRTRINTESRSFELLKVTGAAIFGFIGFIATRRMSLPNLTLKGYTIRTAGLFSGVVGGIVGWDIMSLYGSSRLNSIKKDLVLGAQHMPLWSNPRSAVNPERAFFELADERHNDPLVFHSGLTPDAAARLIPDKVIGSAPPKPAAPGIHHH